MAHQSLERKLSYYNDPEYAAVRHAQSGRLFNWVKVSHGFKKFRLRRWNSTGSWVIIVLGLRLFFPEFFRFQRINNSDLLFPSSQSPEPSGIIDLTNFHVAEGNYTKRKNVFKLTTVPYHHQQQQHHLLQQGLGPTGAQSHQHLAVHHTQSVGLGPSSSGGGSSGSSSVYKGYERELLLQADSHNDMRLWMESLRTVCRSSQYLNSSVSIGGLVGFILDSFRN